MNNQDRQLIKSMMAEMDELMLEDQIATEVQERIRAAQRPPTPYEKTATYLAQQADIEAELATSREERRKALADEKIERERRAVALIHDRIMNAPRLPGLKALKDELAALEAKQHRFSSPHRMSRSTDPRSHSLSDSTVAGGSANTPSMSSSPLLTEGGSCVTTATEQYEEQEMLRAIVSRGKQRREILAALSHNDDASGADIASRMSKHARDLEAARAAAAAAEAYERAFQDMRDQLRHEVLLESFGADAFRTLSPIRVEQADLFLEFEYGDDKEFGIFSEASASLDTIVDACRDKPQLWCFFTSRFEKVSHHHQEPTAVAAANTLPLQHQRSLTFHDNSGAPTSIDAPPIAPASVDACRGAALDVVGDASSNVTLVERPPTTTAPLPASLLQCKEDIALLHSNLATLSEEQRQADLVVSNRQDAIRRVFAKREESRGELSPPSEQLTPELANLSATNPMGNLSTGTAPGRTFSPMRGDGSVPSSSSAGDDNYSTQSSSAQRQGVVFLEPRIWPPLETPPSEFAQPRRDVLTRCGLDDEFRRSSMDDDFGMRAVSLGISHGSSSTPDDARSLLGSGPQSKRTSNVSSAASSTWQSRRNLTKSLARRNYTKVNVIDAAAGDDRDPLRKDRNRFSVTFGDRRSSEMADDTSVGSDTPNDAHHTGAFLVSASTSTPMSAVAGVVSPPQRRHTAVVEAAPLSNSDKYLMPSVAQPKSKAVTFGVEW